MTAQKRVELVHMTPQLQARFAAICKEVFDLLMDRTASPVEAFVVIEFVRDVLAREFGVEEAKFLDYPTEMKQ
jgi:hypothetical protein